MVAAPLRKLAAIALADQWRVVIAIVRVVPSAVVHLILVVFVAAKAIIPLRLHALTVAGVATLRKSNGN
jgi:hypothetical protein